MLLEQICPVSSCQESTPVMLAFLFRGKKGERKSNSLVKKAKNSFAVKMLQGPAETFVNMSLKTALLAGGNK